MALGEGGGSATYRVECAVDKVPLVGIVPEMRTKRKTAWDFVLEVTKTPSSHRDCILWPYYCDPLGYGKCYDPNKLKAGLATRAVCELVYGDPPTPRHQAAHSCRNPSCVNPHHLRWATPQENANDQIEHGTTTRGEKSHSARFTVSEVVAIRERYAKGDIYQVDLAAELGLSLHALHEMLTGESWADAPGPLIENPKKGLPGEKHPLARLTNELARAILLEYAQEPHPTLADLGRQFNVSYGTIRNVVHGFSWTEATADLAHLYRKLP